MSNVLAYKGYFAPVEFNAEQHVLTGMVTGIRDAIVFEGSTAEEVEQCFHDAVDDYLEFCAEKGKEPERAFKGSFNVRTGSELHKQAALAAAKKGKSLNQFVTEAIAAALQRLRKRQKHHKGDRPLCGAFDVCPDKTCQINLYLFGRFA